MSDKILQIIPGDGWKLTILATGDNTRVICFALYDTGEVRPMILLKDGIVPIKRADYQYMFWPAG